MSISNMYAAYRQTRNQLNNKAALIAEAQKIAVKTEATTRIYGNAIVFYYDDYNGNPESKVFHFKKNLTKKDTKVLARQIFQEVVGEVIFNRWMRWTNK